MDEKIRERIMQAYGQAQILVVDDAAFARLIITRELTDMGFDGRQIHQAGSGEAALEKIKQKFFDLIILDITMKGVDGIAVLKAVRRAQLATKVIMCSCRNSEDIVKTCVRFGVDAFIVKPYAPEILQKTLHRIAVGSAQEDAIWHAHCHVCDQKMVEVNAKDTVSFYCPKNCMVLGPWPTVLVTQNELDRTYGKAKRVGFLHSGREGIKVDVSVMKL
ncbi:response regulator [Sporomusa aerivorans]|uniref:response regulator n=1 Tax=Sporomusa aerivorans TaxID=204936 RepID=UPI00352BADBA